jgi:hypothetical protein
MKTAKELYQSIRKPLPPPGRTHRDKTKYTRKKKHKHRYGTGIDSGLSRGPFFVSFVDSPKRSGQLTPSPHVAYG